MYRFLFHNDTLTVLDKEKDSFLGISIDIFALILIPIAIFIIGYFIQAWRENNKENNRIHVLEEYILLQFEELIKDIEKFLKNFSDFKIQFEKTIYQNLVFKGLPILHYKNIISISQTDKYKVFISGKKSKETNPIKLYDSLERRVHSVEQYHILIGEEFKYYMEKINLYNTQWGDNIQEMERSFREFAQTHKSKNISLDSDQFLEEFDIILSTWITTGSNRDIQHVMDKIVTPLHNLCNKYKKDPRREIIINNIIGCLNSYDNMINLREFFRDTVIDCYDKFKEYNIEFTNEIDSFRSLKNKRIRL